MKFKEAVKNTNESVIKLIKHDHWELKESIEFYKQAACNFWYATKVFLRWFLVLCCIPLIPVLYPISVLIRVVKK